jgi:hypothetical protein
VEHVDNARRSAAHVAGVLLRGATDPYDYMCAARCTLRCAAALC